ncbi:MAG TPA: isoprenylcysteine carboxylmethyltransferase family protein [Thermoanaerobaculia bacterium]|nr:isoprenylcysteine carboxylmethyltransferase family protein [Thermoanaerobaculia bacterium]
MTPSRILTIVSAIWVLSEIALGIARRRTAAQAESRDRSSITLLWITITISVFAASYLTRVEATQMPREAFWIGIAVLIAGTLLRWIAIYTLRRFFTVVVTIRADHDVIDHGVYRFIRHPAYTGSLLQFLGLGIAFCNWLSVAAMLLGTGAAFAYRIRVEERALVEALGEKYRAYMTRTKRLIPGVF